jgi:hypothetical protein
VFVHVVSSFFDQRFSIKYGGKGSVQAIKLQRLAWTTVCSHAEKGMATTFHLILCDHDYVQDECLCCYEHFSGVGLYIVKSRKRQ